MVASVRCAQNFLQSVFAFLVKASQLHTTNVRDSAHISIIEFRVCTEIQSDRVREAIEAGSGVGHAVPYRRRFFCCGVSLFFVEQGPKYIRKQCFLSTVSVCLRLGLLPQGLSAGAVVLI
jgi:hypothetical protein